MVAVLHAAGGPLYYPSDHLVYNSPQYSDPRMVGPFLMTKPVPQRSHSPMSGLR